MIREHDIMVVAVFTFFFFSLILFFASHHKRSFSPSSFSKESIFVLHNIHHPLQACAYTITITNIFGVSTFIYIYILFLDTHFLIYFKVKMSSEQADARNSNPKRPPVEITDWNELVRYVS